MTARRLLLAWLCPAVFCAAQDVPRAIQVAEPPPAPTGAAGTDMIVSRSGQFRAAGGPSAVRGSVPLLAEETKTEFLQLTGEKDEWKVPIVIRLHGAPGDPLPARTVALSLVEVGSVSELRVDVHLSRGIEQERFKRAVTAALLYERALKHRKPDAPDTPLQVPPWLTDGLRESTAWRLNQSDRRLYEALFKHGGLFKLEELFATSDSAFENLDGATRAAFRVSAGALVMALLEQPQGKEGFRAFLDNVAGYAGEMPGLLRQHFPELNLSETSLAKWWTLQLANKGGLSLLTDILTITQSETALTDALQLHFRSEDGIIQQKPLSAWPELSTLKPPDRLAAIRPAQDALVRLSYRCFPSYRPLLHEYQQVLDAIAKNQTRDLSTRLAALQQTRNTMIARASRARDYLDWFEITRARQTSGEFDDYLRLKERLKAPSHPRKDPLAEYLDRMDKAFHR